MDEGERLSLAILLVLGAVIGVAIISIIAGNITNNILSDFPSVADSMGAGVSLAVFVGLLLKIGNLFL